MEERKMPAQFNVKVFSKIGVIYTKIFEKDVDSLDEVMKIIQEWWGSDLIEVFYSDRLLFVYTNS